MRSAIDERTTAQTPTAPTDEANPGRGTGENALFLAGRGIDIVGIDASAVAVEPAPSSIRSRPRVADSVSILGRRTYSAGEASIVPSITAKR